MRNLSFNLSRGTLDLEITSEIEPFDSLVGVAERINPKRSFLFVSKVIGRYVPTSLQEMLRISNLLGDQVPTTLLTGNVTVLSLSETALGLGSLVHNHFKNRDIKAVNAFTSRHLMSVPIYSKFEEPHSHLPSHYVYRSFNADVNTHFDNTDTLVLIDDEITTGNTLSNLYRSLKLSKVKRVILLSLTDWSGEDAFNWGDIELYKFSLISGTYNWTPNSITSEVVELPYDSTKINGSQLIPLSPGSTRLPSFDGLCMLPPRKGSNLFTPRHEASPLICLYYNELLPQAIEAMVYKYGFEKEVYFLSLSSSPLEVGLDIYSKIEIEGFYSDIPVYVYNLNEFVSGLDRPVFTLIYEPDSSAPFKNKFFNNPLNDLISLLDIGTRPGFYAQQIDSQYAINFLDLPHFDNYSKPVVGDDASLSCLF